MGSTLRPSRRSSRLKPRAGRHARMSRKSSLPIRRMGRYSAGIRRGKTRVVKRRISAAQRIADREGIRCGTRLDAQRALPSPTVIRAMYDALEKWGFARVTCSGTVLRRRQFFFGMLPE